MYFAMAKGKALNPGEVEGPNEENITAALTAAKIKVNIVYLIV